jgi:hypothetical protein
VSDRLAELQRQRELLRDHLAWIEREIAAESGLSRPEIPNPPPSARPVHREPVAAPEAEAILAEFRQPSLSIANQTKAGCIAYFALAVGLLALLVTGFYFYMKTMRGR